MPNSRAIVLQQCGQCRRAGSVKGRLIRAQRLEVGEHLVKAKRPCAPQDIRRH